MTGVDYFLSLIMGIVVIYSKVLPFIYIILTKETVCLCISGYTERERVSKRGRVRERQRERAGTKSN